MRRAVPATARSARRSTPSSTATCRPTPIAAEVRVSASVRTARRSSGTYGWAWLLKLAAELASRRATAAHAGRATLAAARQRVRRRATSTTCRARTIRSATACTRTAHSALRFALDYARAVGERRARALRASTRRTHGSRRIATLPAAVGAVGRRLPVAGADRGGPDAPRAGPPRHSARGSPLPAGLRARAPATLFTPVAGIDRNDPQIVHLDGLNLSRAWCLRGIAAALAAGRQPRRRGPPGWRRASCRRLARPRERRFRRRALARDVRGAGARLPLAKLAA